MSQNSKRNQIAAQQNRIGPSDANKMMNEITLPRIHRDSTDASDYQIGGGGRGQTNEESMITA